MAAGVRQRHGLKCNRRGRCDCSWEASVYSKRDGKKIRKAFPTRAAATGWRADKLAAARRGKLRVATPMTLRQAALELVVGMRDGSVPTRTGARYKPATIRGYEESLNLRLLDALGERRLADIELVDVQDLADQLTAAGASASTVQNTLDPLRVIYRRAIRRDLVSVDPTEGLELRRPDGQRDRIASPSEAAALLAALPDGERAVWATGFYAGLRRGELRALRWSDIDLAAKVIHVQRGWDAVEGEQGGNNRIEKFSATGTFIEAIGWGVSNSEAKLEVCTTSCKAGIAGSGNGQFHEPGGLTFSGSNLYVADYANNRVEELSSTGSYLSQFGSPGNGGGQFKGPEPIATDAAGNVYVVDTGQDRVEEFSASGTFIATFGSQGNGEGQLGDPEGISINSAGDVYISDATNNRIEEWVPANQAAHDTQTIYYTPKTEATVPACQNHPEWANLPCQTQPAGQPETSGLPNLPVTDVTYNMWDQAETITETFGSTTRTRKNTFDNAGRPLTSEETSAVDKAFPKVTDEYNKETGALEKESTTVEGKTKTITKIINARGQLTSYTDADGATTKYTYDLDGRTEEVSDSKGYEIYAYDPTTGFLTKLLDSAAKTFTASYDVEGKMLTESYPNGMNANYTASPVGQDVKVEYVKTTNCTSGCTWFSDAIVPSIHGETLAQTSTLSSEAYAYDNAGRLLQTQETPAGKGCVTRIYAYDEESNRRSLTTREPGSKGECVTEGGTVERHIYDPANRLIDSGVSYEALGNITNLPASDAGTNELTSSYYVDSQVASQTQNGETINYNYDPTARTRETISSGKTASTVVTHYDGPGNALSWTSENAEKWTRNIPGIGGEVAATQTNAGTPVLQLHDLNGNIVATAALSETETKLLSTYNSTEFGVPTTSSPPKYSWLGADGVASELPSGDIAQDGNTYIPLTGLPLQTQPVELPLPINIVTPFTDAAPPWVGEQAGLSGAEEVAAANEAKKAVEGPIEDPINHYRAWEAEQKSEQLLRLVAAGNLTEALGTVFGTLADAIDGYILGKGLTEVAFTWLEEFGQFLSACVRELRANNDSHGGCRASYSDILSLPDFWIKPEVSFVWMGKMNRVLSTG